MRSVQPGSKGSWTSPAGLVLCLSVRSVGRTSSTGLTPERPCVRTLEIRTSPDLSRWTSTPVLPASAASGAQAPIVLASERPCVRTFGRTHQCIRFRPPSFQACRNHATRPRRSGRRSTRSARGAERAQGRGSDALGSGGSQMRRNTGPAPTPAVVSQRPSARTGQSSRSP